MLRVKSATGEMRDVLVIPIKASGDAKLRYAEWEYTRRLNVDSESHNQIGYVHLQAMGRTTSISGPASITPFSTGRDSSLTFAKSWRQH